MKRNGSKILAALAVLLAGLAPAQAYWLTVLSDDLSTNGSAWTYSGVSNSTGQALIRYDSVNQNIHAEWNETNLLITTGDPYIMIPSRLSRPLARVLTDNDTFRLRATLNLVPGSVANTVEGYQIANIGLYDVSQMGPDRTLSDDWSTNTNLLRDGSDFVEFNYFIYNTYPGSTITAVIGAHVDGDDDFVYDAGVGSEGAMGVDHWLPEGTNLYVEVEYFGAATDTLGRVAHCAIYTDPDRTNLLVVNGVTMSYWTQPLPAERTFRVTDVAFYNYVQKKWDEGNVTGAGAGTIDDISVEQYFEPGQIFSNSLQNESIVSTWAAESGTTYYAQFCSNLLESTWATVAVIQATSDTLACTNGLNGGWGCYRVTY